MVVCFLSTPTSELTLDRSAHRRFSLLSAHSHVHAPEPETSGYRGYSRICQMLNGIDINSAMRYFARPCFVIRSIILKFVEDVSCIMTKFVVNFFSLLFTLFRAVVVGLTVGGVPLPQWLLGTVGRESCFSLLALVHLPKSYTKVICQFRDVPDRKERFTRPNFKSVKLSNLSFVSLISAASYGFSRNETGIIIVSFAAADSHTHTPHFAR